MCSTAKLVLVLALYAALPIAVRCQVLWGERVLSVSSEYGGGKYASKEALGKPDVFPQLSVLDGCWSPQPGVTSAQVVVGFREKSTVQQVALFLANGAQYVSLVSLLTEDEKEIPLNLSSLYPIAEGPRVLHLFTQQPTNATGLRVYFNLHHAKKPLMLDAVAVSGDKTPVVAEINLDSTYTRNLTRKPMDGPVNSVCDELQAIPDYTGQWMLFARKNCPTNREGAQSYSGDVYFARRGNGYWGGIRSFSDKVNNYQNNEPAGVASNGKTVYISGKYGVSGTTPLVLAIIQTDSTGATNTDPVPVLIRDFYSFDEKENTFYVHPEEQVLLLSADRREGEGRTDLYVCFRQADGSFGAPKWLGPVVNTAAFDFAPFLSQDLQRLYFASYGFAGYGSADVYVSSRLDNSWTNWSTPINLGPVVNSSKFDAYFRETGDRSGILSSTQQSMGYGDLFTIEPLEQEVMECQPVPVAHIPDSLRSYPQHITWLPAAPARLSLRIGEWTLADTMLAESSFIFPYTSGHKLHVIVFAEGYLPASDTIFTNYGDSAHAIALQAVEIGKAYRLQQIAFSRDSADLLPESEATLRTLAAWLLAQPTLRIEIVGHTEPGGSRKYNQLLSEKRAKAVEKYLIRLGVAGDRLHAIGYGSSRPVAGTSNESQRRVEFRILP